jgi:hypothetical protein
MKPAAAYFGRARFAKQPERLRRELASRLRICKTAAQCMPAPRPLEPLAMTNVARCPFCDARIDDHESSCPRCGRVLGANEVTSLGHGTSPEPLRLDDERPIETAHARTAFGIHVLDVGAPASDGGTARAAPPRHHVPLDTLVGRRPPGSPVAGTSSGLGVDAFGTVVGVRVPIAPRDAESTQLNALGTADRLVAESETFVLSTRNPDQTSVGVSLEDLDLPSVPRVGPAKLADDWLDDISDYLKDYEGPSVVESPATPAPSPTDDPPAFGILRRRLNRAAPTPEPDRHREHTPLPETSAPSTTEDSQVARIQPQTVHRDQLRSPVALAEPAPNAGADVLLGPEGASSSVADRVPPPRFGAALDGLSAPIGAPLPPSANHIAVVPSVTDDRDVAPIADNHAVDAAFADTLAASDAGHAQALEALLRDTDDGPRDRMGSRVDASSTAPRRVATRRTASKAAASRAADPTEKKLRWMTLALLAILAALLAWIVDRS